MKTTRWTYKTKPFGLAFIYNASGKFVGITKWKQASTITSTMNRCIQQREERTAQIKKIVKPGDRVSRNMCAGLKSTFIFSHWEGEWMCGKTISDCHPMSVYKINGKKI